MALRNSYTLDGVPLTHPQALYFPERETGVRVVPAKRNMNISYPGVDGDTFMKGAPFTPGGVTIKMFIHGDTHQQFMENVEFVNGLFLQRHKLLELRHDYDSAGTVSRHAFVKCRGGTEIERLGTQDGIIEYLLDIPGVFWRSVNSSDWNSGMLTAAQQTFIINNLTGGNAPVVNSLIRVKGGFSTCTVTDVASGSSITVNTPCTDTEYVIVDPVLWTARKVTTNTWSGGAIVDSQVTSNRGMGHMIQFEPSIVSGALRYQAYASVTNPSGTPSFAVRAKKAYL